MNPLALVKNVLGSITGKVDEMIEHMPTRRVKSIKQTYFLVIFVLVVIGAFWGRYLGGEAAGIKMPPLASSVRDVFEYDVYKERGEGGDLDLMIESERISGQSSKAIDKIAFPSREPFDMEYEGGIVDYKRDKRLTAPEMEMSYQPLEGKYAEPMGRPEPQVAPLNKTLNPASPKTDISWDDHPKTDSPEIAPLKTDISDPVKTEHGKTDVPVNEKRAPVNQNRDFPKPITDGTGILE